MRFLTALGVKLRIASRVILLCLTQCKPVQSQFDLLQLKSTRIMFVREFAVIDAAVSVEQLRLRLKDSELEQYGDAFIPDFVYDVIRRLPRFSSMRVSQSSKLTARVPN